MSCAGVAEPGQRPKTGGSIKGGGQELKYLAETQDPLA